MSHFHGRFDYSIDAKGRVNLPAKFRKGLNPQAEETFIISRAPGGCLRAYPKDLWEIRENELSSRAETPETIRIKRLLYDSLSDTSLDAQGRISLTQIQMQIAGIGKEVTMAGQGNYIEIWDTARYNQYQGTADDFDAAYFHSANSGHERQ